MTKLSSPSQINKFPQHYFCKATRPRQINPSCQGFTVSPALIKEVMASAVCSKVFLLPAQAYQPKSGDKILQQKGTCTNRVLSATGLASAGGKGGGVLDRPTIEKSTPGRDSEFDLRKSRKVSPPYRVLLHNDNYNKREYVVQVLMKVIPGMTLDIAVNIMQEAHTNDIAVVIICAQVDAEEHCMKLRGNGLLSSIEPASGNC